jgi:excisionase family DNA binding protein
MAYPQHRPDLITVAFGGRGDIVLYREIGGHTWNRHVGLDDTLTPMEASVVLGVHRVTIYDWIEKGFLTTRPGGHGDVLVWRDVRTFARYNGLIQ